MLVGTPKIYIATAFGERIKIRESLKETAPCHADMLRYDGAFCDPNDVSRIVFPKWKGYNQTITLARWSSFCIKLTPSTSESDYLEQIDEWYTFVHSVPDYKLVQTTFREFQAKNPKMKLVGWK